MHSASMQPVQRMTLPLAASRALTPAPLCLPADPSALQAAQDQQHQLPDLLLLDYLAAAGGASSSSSHDSSDSNGALVSARRFVCCRMLHDAIHADIKVAKQPQELTLLLVQHRKLQDSSQLSVLGEPFVFCVCEVMPSCSGLATLL